MARKTEDNHKPNVLLSIVERYYAEKSPSKRPKYSQLGEYSRSIGFDIKDHIFQRSPEVREYLDKISASTEEDIRLSVAVYDTLDTDKFVKVNNTPSKLKAALQERDSYYRQVTASAGKIFDANKELTEKNARILAENRRLSNENNRLLDENATVKKEIKKEREQNKKLRDIIDTWVTPEIANELLKKEGLLKNTGNIVKSELIDEKVLHGDSDIGGLIDSMIKRIESE